MTFFFVENLTGEGLKYKDERLRAYLVANGWDGMMGEEDLKGLAEDGQEPGEGLRVEDVEKK